MSRATIATALLTICGCAGAAPGLESRHGFDVQIEALADPIRVNGLPLVVHRASGRGVELLANAIGKQWSQEDGDHGIRSVAQGPWTVLSRIHNDSLEVLQWRGAGANAELLWSRSDLRARIRKPPSAGIRLPVGCVSGHTVHGNVDADAFIQRTAHCHTSPRATISALEATARRQGFTVESQGGSQFLARRAATEIRVLAWGRNRPGASDGTTLVYLQVEQGGRAQ